MLEDCLLCILSNAFRGHKGRFPGLFEQFMNGSFMNGSLLSVVISEWLLLPLYCEAEGSYKSESFTDLDSQETS